MDKGSKYNKYGSDKELPTTFSLWEVYQYSDQLLKHMPTNALKTIQKTHLFSRKPVYFADTSYERRNHNGANIDFTGLSKSDERTYFDSRASSGYVKEAEKLERSDSKINLQITLKDTADFNLRVRVWAYSLSEYLYVLSKSGLTLKHRTYTINQTDEDFLE